MFTTGLFRTLYPSQFVLLLFVCFVVVCMRWKQSVQWLVCPEPATKVNCFLVSCIKVLVALVFLVIVCLLILFFCCISLLVAFVFIAFVYMGWKEGIQWHVCPQPAIWVNCLFISLFVCFFVCCLRWRLSRWVLQWLVWS